MCRFHNKIYIYSAVRPSSVTDNLRGRYCTISDYDLLLMMAESGLTINILPWNWHIINPTSHHDEIPLSNKIKLLAVICSMLKNLLDPL